MSQHSQWLRAIPGGKGVGTEARMDEGEVALEARVLEVRVKGPQLWRSELPLVHDERGGKGTNVKPDSACQNLVRRPFPVRAVSGRGKKGEGTGRRR